MNTNFKMKKSFGLLAVIFALPMLMLYQNCSKVGVSDIPDGVGVSNTGNPGNPGNPGSPGCAVGDPTCDNTPTSGNPQNPPPTCTIPITNTVDNIKVLFLIDISGSNAVGDPLNGNVASDPSTKCSNQDESSTTCKPWRLGVLDKFLGIGGQAASYLSKGNFSFQFGTFNGSTATALITSNQKAVFSNDQNTVIGAVRNFLSKSDNNATPYGAVLNSAASWIKYDIGGAAVPASKYVVIMLTDGMPSDDQFNVTFKSGANKGQLDTAANTAALRSAVAQVMNVAPGYITFNTVLYYPTGHEFVDAEAYLQEMANAGKGLFNKADSKNIPFTIDDHVQAPTGSVDPNKCPVAN